MLKQDKEAEKKNSKRGVRNIEERFVDNKRESSKQGLTSAEVWTRMLPGGRDYSPP